MYLGNIHNMIQSLLETFFSNPPKMALFGLNWEESKWPGHFCFKVLYFFASKIGVKFPPGKKVPWHWRWAALGRVSNCHFFQKNAFFGQKKAFFQKVHFVQKCSVTQNTVFQCVKKFFFGSNPKLIFFTKFNLRMSLICKFHLITSMCRTVNRQTVQNQCFTYPIVGYFSTSQNANINIQTFGRLSISKI